jgi:hypothetical protein
MTDTIQFPVLLKFTYSHKLLNSKKKSSKIYLGCKREVQQKVASNYLLSLHEEVKEIQHELKTSSLSLEKF